MAAVVAVVVVLAVGAGLLLGRRSAPSVSPRPRPPRPGPVVPAGLVTFRDAQGGYEIKYPREWKELRRDEGPLPPEGSVRLALSAGDLDAVIVRVVPLDKPVNTSNVADIKAVTDGILGDAPVKVLQQGPHDVNGLPGYFYLYTFADQESGQEGVHLHYFVFNGQRMNILVFQALPTTSYSRRASLFDQVLESFRALPAASTPPASDAPR